jgi:hypothetical protein
MLGKTVRYARRLLLSSALGVCHGRGGGRCRGSLARAFPRSSRVLSSGVGRSRSVASLEVQATGIADVMARGRSPPKWCFCCSAIATEDVSQDSAWRERRGDKCPGTVVGNGKRMTYLQICPAAVPSSFCSGVSVENACDSATPGRGLVPVDEGRSVASVTRPSWFGGAT